MYCEQCKKKKNGELLLNQIRTLFARFALYNQTFHWTLNNGANKNEGENIGD